jgi:hypothetical protein
MITLDDAFRKFRTRLELNRLLKNPTEGIDRAGRA